MKIAVCISGQPRNYEKGYQELKKWFLDRYDCDVYIHTWKDKVMEAGHKYVKERTYEFIEDDYNRILELYQPKDYFFQKPIPFDTKEIKGPTIGYKLNSTLSASYSIYAAYQLAKQSNVNYDLVIRTRFDLEFTDYISPECIFLKDLSLLDPNKISLFEYPKTEEGYPTRLSEVDDLFAVGSPEVSEVYSSYFSHVLRNVYLNEDYTKFLDEHISENPDPIYPESLLKYHLVTNGVEINYVNSLTEHFTANIIR